MFKKIFILLVATFLAIILTFLQEFLSNQRPVMASTIIKENKYSFYLPVINEGVVDCIIELNVPDTSIWGKIYYQLHGNNNNRWYSVRLLRLNDKLVSILPYQKPNVKLAYYIELYDEQNNIYPICKDNPIVLRYKAHVPKIITYTSVVLFFIAIIIIAYLAIITGYLKEHFVLYVKWAFYLLLISVFFQFVDYVISYRNLLMQPSLYNDLTFYKNLLIFICWLIVYKVNQKHENRIPTLIISWLVLFLYFLPDHLIFSFLY